MNKNLVVAGAMVLLTVGAFAQNRQRGFNKSDITPEQMAELQTKKMALQLDLTDAQQKKVLDLNKEMAVERKAKREEMKVLREKGEKPEKGASFENQKARLDAQLAHQESMKKILDEDQYTEWKDSRKQRADKMKMRGKQKGKKGEGRRKRGEKRSGDGK